MVHMREASGHSPQVASGAAATSPSPAADGERILLLECRLDQAASALDGARADADRLRKQLAEAAAREADHARRFSLVQRDLADARGELAALHERLASTEAMRAELEGHLFEAGARGDAGELLRIRRELIAEQQRSLANEQTASRLRARVNELLLSRDTLLTRIAEWQLLVGHDESGAVDLAEFMAELRRDIMMLEQRNVVTERREVALRQRLARAGMDPDTAFDDDIVVAVDEPPAPADTDVPEIEEPELTEPTEVGEPGTSTWAGFVNTDHVFAGQQQDDGAAGQADGEVDAASTLTDATDWPAPLAAAPVAVSDATAYAPVDLLSANDPAVRAAAYERLIRVNEGSPEFVEHVRAGLADCGSARAPQDRARGGDHATRVAPSAPRFAAG